MGQKLTPIAQIYWVTPALTQVSRSSLSFNAVKQTRILGRLVRALTITNQSPVAKIFFEFEEIQETCPIRLA